MVIDSVRMQDLETITTPLSAFVCNDFLSLQLSARFRFNQIKVIDSDLRAAYAIHMIDLSLEEPHVWKCGCGCSPHELPTLALWEARLGYGQSTALLAFTYPTLTSYLRGWL